MSNLQGFPVGLARAFFWTYPTTGVQAGVCTGTQTTLANAGISSPYLMSNVKTFGLTYTQPTELQIQGGDRIVAVPMFGNPRLAPFDVVGSDIDDSYVTLIQGTTTNTTNTQYTKYSWNPNRTTPNGSIGMACQQRFETGTGFTYFLTRVIPRAAVSAHPGQMAFRAESDTTSRVSSITGTVNYNGQTYGSSGMGFTAEADKMDYFDVYSPAPFFITVLREDGTVTTITLPYRPLSTVVTLNATQNELFIVDNTVGAATATALSAITTGASATATLAAAGTAGYLAVLTYTTNFVPS